MNARRRATLGVVLVVVLLVWGVVYGVGKSKNRQAVVVVASDMAEKPTPTPVLPEETAVLGTPPTPTAPTVLRVYIHGEVNNPDVYEMPEGARVIDVLDKAGGETAEADLSINLAKPVTDGEEIIIPKIGETVDKTPVVEQNGVEATSEPVNDPVVNINTADAEQLNALPGVGEATAGSIIMYREKNGPFAKKEDIMNVPRIGEKVYKQFEEFIRVE